MSIFIRNVVQKEKQIHFLAKYIFFRKGNWQLFEDSTKDAYIIILIVILASDECCPGASHDRKQTIYNGKAKKYESRSVTSKPFARCRT